MGALLLKLLELSLQAGALIAAILLIRLVFRRLPAKYLCILWMVVAVRLMIPFSVESSLGLMPNVGAIMQESVEVDTESVDYFESGGTMPNPGAGNPVTAPGTDSHDEIDYYLVKISSEETETYVPDEKGADANDEIDYYISDVNVNSGAVKVHMATEKGTVWREKSYPLWLCAWLSGIALLLGYSVFSCFKVRRMVKNAILFKENIWLCEGLESPFLFGWIHPRIYLPCDLEEQQMQYVIEHEKAHIARGDNFAKLAGYLLLSVYWFHPLVWAAYVLFCKDVERACDERVIAEFGAEDRKGYADALLKCSVDRRFAISHPLAFGETDVKKRITGILNYKKPGRWLTLAAVLLCLCATAGCFLVQKQAEAESMQDEVLPTPMITPVVRSETPTPTPDPALPTPTENPIYAISVNPQEGSDRELLGNTLPETLVAVPVGQTIRVDLDGDGVEDTVTFGVEGYEGSTSYKDVIGDLWYEVDDNLGAFFLQINDNTFFKGEDRKFWDAGPCFTTYYIFDIDVTDGYKEIGLCSYGPNVDSQISLYRYVNGILAPIGGFCDAPLESDRYGNDYRAMPYEEMVTQVERENFLISVPGDGTILCEEHEYLLETTSVVQEYRLINAESGTEARLERSLRERYEFTGWNLEREENYEVTAAVTFGAWRMASMDLHESVVIPEGSTITFYDYYPHKEWGDGWVRFFYTLGEKWELEAWIYVEDGNIWIMGGKEKLQNLFKNLNQAG